MVPDVKLLEKGVKAPFTGALVPKPSLETLIISFKENKACTKDLAACNQDFAEIESDCDGIWKSIIASFFAGMAVNAFIHNARF